MENPPLCCTEGDNRKKKLSSITLEYHVVPAIENPYDRWLES